MKLDLHTHCYDATNILVPTIAMVGKILAQIEKQGLNGIAVTEHYNKEYGYQIKELAKQYYDGKAVVIPGQEIRVDGHHVVELYLPDGSTFRFLAHPNFALSSPEDFLRERPAYIHGIEIGNCGYQLDSERITEVAKGFNLLRLTNSDAHSVDSIGCLYNEVDIDRLSALARRSK